MSDTLEKRKFEVRGKEESIDFDEFDGFSIREIVVKLIEHHDRLESCLDENEYVLLKCESSWGDPTSYSFQVYREETDNEYKHRMSILADEKKSKEDKEKAMLNKLLQKYPELSKVSNND